VHAESATGICGLMSSWAFVLGAFVRIPTIPVKMRQMRHYDVIIDQ